MSGTAVKLSGPLRQFARKEVDQAAAWLNSAVTFGLTGTVGLLYFTDWRAFVTYIPFYNTKFKEESE